MRRRTNDAEEEVRRPLIVRDVEVTCDDTNNPPEDVERGVVRADVVIYLDEELAMTEKRASDFDTHAIMKAVDELEKHSVPKVVCPSCKRPCYLWRRGKGFVAPVDGEAIEECFDCFEKGKRGPR